jgi:hypothetical protein
MVIKLTVCVFPLLIFEIFGVFLFFPNRFSLGCDEKILRRLNFSNSMKLQLSSNTTALKAYGLAHFKAYLTEAGKAPLEQII